MQLSGTLFHPIDESRPGIRRPWGFSDLAGSAMVLFGTTIWLWLMQWPGARAAEDAAILFRYAENVAAGHGVVWNVGGAPVDGATDMGFMFFLAGVKMSAGIDVQIAALAASTVAFFGIIALLFVFGRHRVGPWLASLACAMFVVSPGVSILNVGFGAVFFSLFVALSTLAMFKLVEHPSRMASMRFALVAGLAGIVRPEGFIVDGLLLVAALIIGGRKVLVGVIRVAALLAGIGILFVAARWFYFGYPLPNPYYKKGAGQLHLGGLRHSVAFALRVGLAPLFLLLAGFTVFGPARRWMAYVLTVVASLAMWVLLSNEMNFLYRFQFFVLPMTLLMLIDLVAHGLPQLRSGFTQLDRSRRVLLASGLFLLVVANWVLVGRLVTTDDAPGPQERIARVLSAKAGEGLTVATTEAGYVCWKSGWDCVDLWGLNDKKIAHEGLLDEVGLAELDPDVIVIHAPTSPTASGIHAGLATSTPGWERMTDPAIRYAEKGGYELAAILSPLPNSGFVVYVRAGKPWSRDLISEFGALLPTMHESYGLPAGLPVSLPTNE